MDNELSKLENASIRKIWHNDEWYFSVVDVVNVLTESTNPKRYWTDLKRKLESEGSQLYDKIVQLKLKSADGKAYKTDAATTDRMLRLIMSIPSPKAEPLKIWLAQVGAERIEETENPELLTERQIAVYKAKGYSDEWIKERLHNISTRKRLTEEWQQRGVKDGQEFSILTAIIAKGTFELTPTEHKEMKGLTKPSDNLRDHMTPLELIFTSLGEELTRVQAVNDDAQGFDKNKGAAIKGGTAAGNARKKVEKEMNINVVSKDNFKGLKAAKKKEELPPSKEEK